MRYAIFARRYDVEAPLAVAIAHAMAPRGLEISTFVVENESPAADVVVALREVGLALPHVEALPLETASGTFDTAIVLDGVALPHAVEAGELVRLRLTRGDDPPLRRARRTREELRLVLADVFRRRRESAEDPRADAQRRTRTVGEN